MDKSVADTSIYWSVWPRDLKVLSVGFNGDIKHEDIVKTICQIARHMPNLEELSLDMPSVTNFGISLEPQRQQELPKLDKVVKLSLPYNTHGGAGATKLIMDLCPNVNDFRFLWTASTVPHHFCHYGGESDPLLHYGPKLKRIQLERSISAGFEMGNMIKWRIQDFCHHASFSYVDV